MFLLPAALTIMINACAKISSPTGGPRDRTPPVVLKSVPENATTNFKGNSLVTTFDEYVVLDNISEKFMVSPPMAKKPRIFMKGKNVIVEFEEELKDSTTYTFYFQDAIKDLKIKEFMATNVATVTENTPVEEAARIMVDGQISGLPVVRDGEVVGVITETDIFKVFLEIFGARQPGIRVAFLLSQAPGQLATVSTAIAKAGGNLIALGSFLGETSENVEITMKIDSMEQQEVVDILTPLVEKILDIRKMSIV